MLARPEAVYFLYKIALPQLRNGWNRGMGSLAGPAVQVYEGGR